MKKADWMFSADGKGFLSLNTKGTRVRCSIKQPFTYSIIGDSIKIVSGLADTMVGGDSGDSMSKQKEQEYSNKTYTLLLTFEGSKDLIMGSAKLIFLPNSNNK